MNDATVDVNNISIPKLKSIITVTFEYLITLL